MAAPAPRTVVAATAPSFVFVIVDDLDEASVTQLPRLDQLARQGLRFTNAFSSTPICCPSRVSMLRGEYTHNHTISFNFDSRGTCSERFRELGYEHTSLGAWLQAAGYRTGWIGKYLNRYPGARTDPGYVPAGWDDWHVPIFAGAASDYFDYSLNENGRIVSYGSGAQDYSTDVLADRAEAFIRSSGDTPFFLQLNPAAPHRPAVPAPRHLGSFAELLAPRTPSFNEADMSDKPVWYQRSLTPMSERDIAGVDALYRDRLRSMLSVEELLQRVDDALLATGRSDNTYVIFTSDHGFHLGQHRFRQGKGTPYEPSLRIPLIMRGPQVPVGVDLAHLVSNVDLPATIAELAGIAIPGDGRSVVPLLSDRPPEPGSWRSELLLEHPTNSDGDDEDGIPSWWGLRTLDSTYVEYETGEVEYYDLRTDPDQLESLHDRTDPGLLDDLARRLAAKRSCSGANCG
jgi:arylsulfatase A-like enzyme